MENKHSTKFLRKRKFMLVLPLLIIPFLTMAFWALGGGSGGANSTGVHVKGLNLELPDSDLGKDEETDKLSFYNKVSEDSLRFMLERQNDPFFKDGLENKSIMKDYSSSTYSNKLKVSPFHSANRNSGTEAQIYERLDAINKVITEPAEPQQYSQEEDGYDNLGNDDRLESMMQLMNERETDDPELAQLASMLDKIIDIQHPERMKDKPYGKSLKSKTEVFPVNAERLQVPITYLGSSDDPPINSINGFYGTGSANILSKNSNAVSAVIHASQTVSPGSTVKLRLLTDIYVNGILISKGSFVFGTAALEDERMQIKIPVVRNGNNLLPVSLTVYDLDGLAGISVPGSIEGDELKQSADRSLQSLELMSMDPSLKAQATSATVQTLKGMLSKKVKQVKITLKAGHKVLLRDNNKQ